MSKLGFNKAIANYTKMEQAFFRRGMRAAQQEFKRNFDTESDAETGRSWDMVLRGYPPPILDVTGQLRAEALSSKNVKIYRGKAVLTVDPIDGRGRGYAAYHQDGDGVNQRKFLTQSTNLTRVQTNILLDCFDGTIKNYSINV